MQIIIDRFEDKTAVCEKPDRSMIDIPRSKLPKEAKEGDVLIIEGNSIRIDTITTEKRRKNAESKMRENTRKFDQ
jgi:hypothetical protein